MKQYGINHPRLNTLVAFCLAAGLSACGGGGGGTSTSSIEAAQVDVVTLSGSVGDGPIVGANVSVYAANGKLISTFSSDSYANFSVGVSIPKGSYPLLVEAKNGVDLVTGSAPDFTLLSVVENNSDSQVNLNPHSTLIVATAQQMPGGLKSNSNIAAASNIVMTKMNYGLDTSLIQDPIRTHIDSSSISNIVKSSETIGEMIRRTRDNVSGSGYITSGNDVIQSLAADLTDGSLDGRGASGANARISAVANLITGQVAIEAMRNSLYVNGVNATSALDSAIKTTLPATPGDSLTSSVPVNSKMIDQAKMSVAAAYAFAPSPKLITLASSLDSIIPGSSSASVAQILPSSSTADITQVITLAASANDSELERINTAATTVTPANQDNTAPTISGTPQTSVKTGNVYSFQPTAADADAGTTLTFSIANRPAWASFSNSTGRLSGTPGNTNVGTTSGIEIRVSDGTTSTALPAFSLTVTSVNSAPVVSNSPATSVKQGSAYSYTPAATDPDGNTLTFSITNRPSWASFSSSTGRLSGTPNNANVGSTTGIAITVSDGAASTTIGPFTLTVVNINDAPTITGTPSTSVTVGKLYSFTPNASDIDGNSLTFSVSGKPSWLTFNTSTGQLSGTPGSVNVGSTGLITISVSDGTASVALPSFSISVSAAQPVTGSAALSWNAPTTRTDGTALSMSEIGGYTVRYGTSAGSYTKTVTISDAYTMNYTFASLTQGTYYFVVTAFDKQGQSSGNSSSVSAVIQ